MAKDPGFASPEHKILSQADAVARHGPERPHRLVFTNGCFDLLHRGHVELLWWARRHGDALVLGLNSDESVRRLKGPGRPLTSEGDRAFLLAALPVVDAVVIFEEDTPIELIRALQPDVIVKGGDYRVDDVVGADVVQARGGKVAIFPAVAGHSTSALVQRMRTSRQGRAGGTGESGRSEP